MVVGPTLLGTDMEARPQVGKRVCMRTICIGRNRSSGRPLPRSGGQAPSRQNVRATFQNVNHLEDARTPNGLGLDLAAKRVVEVLETRSGTIWIPAALGPAEGLFEMHERNTDLDQVWTLGALSPDLAARHQADRLFEMLTRISQLELC